MACAIYSSARVRPLDYKNHLFTTTFGAACHHLPVGGVRVHISEMQLGIVTFFFFFFFSLLFQKSVSTFCKKLNLSFSFFFYQFWPLFFLLLFLLLLMLFFIFIFKFHQLTFYLIQFFIQFSSRSCDCFFFFFVFYPFIAFFSTSSLNILLHLIVLIQFWFSLF